MVKFTYLLPVLGCMSALAYADDLALPTAPADNKECVESEFMRTPVVSYRISDRCDMIDISGVGDYQYGVNSVKQEVKGFKQTEVIRRFKDGNFQLLKEVKIELRRASEDPAVLVCHMDIMGNNVIDARIIRNNSSAGGRDRVREEPLVIDKNKLPNLGIYTHTKTVTYTDHNCST